LLVVDDEPYILATLSILLKSADYEVITASSGEAAQQLFAQHPIDIILSDQKMPRMNGIELLEWVRIHHPRTVRLLMTGFAELENAVDAINRGQVFRYVFKPWKTEQLEETLETAARTFRLERRHDELVHELQTMNEELERRVSVRTRELNEAMHDLEQKNKMLEKLALTDPLTGLPNRRAMDRLAERELRRRERVPSPIAIGIVDVDHFKNINDRFLLPGGDKVLVDLARVLQSSARNVDFVGRIGGEEFMIIAPETNLDGAEVLGERIRTTVEGTTFTFQDQVIPVRVSIGFAIAEADNQPDFDAMKHQASTALSEAKKSGRNRCLFFTVGPRPPFEAAS
jgi:diguanylate cyclase (GGDEF)-like protein